MPVTDIYDPNCTCPKCVERKARAEGRAVDIVERLRGHRFDVMSHLDRGLLVEAADEIDRLRAANNRLHEQIEGLNELLVRVQKQPA